MRTWQRLEPRTRDQTLEAGLLAAVHDPLWLLARQWQWGEFMGEDAGSPVSTRVTFESNRLSRIRGRDEPGAGRPYDPATAPLEAAVEAEPRATLAELNVDAGGGVWSAEAGLHLVRRLRHALDDGWDAGALVSQFRLDPDRLPPGRHALAGAPDGRALRHALSLEDFVDDFAHDVLGVPTNELTGAVAVIDRWTEWLDARVPAPDATGRPPAWVPERMEYAVTVAAPGGQGETALAADGYVGGRLDWHAFRAAPAGAPALGAAGPRPHESRALLPTPVRFPGMPHERWWTFEDGGLDVGALDAAPEDLARLVLTEFVVGYGNDWFALVLDLEVGTVTDVHRVEVMNTFGDVTLAAPVSRAGDPWQMFRVSGSDAFLLAPALPPHPEGPPVEEVRLGRDEGANLVWAVERTAADPVTGAVLDRHEQYQRGRTGARRGPAAAPVSYRLGTEVPGHWVPLVPEPDDDGHRSTRLVQGRLLNTETGHTGAPIGRLLGETTWLHEEEAPRAGARVTRGHALARWSDGSTHVWIGRRKRPGRIDASSGLLHDVVEPSGEVVEPPPDPPRVYDRVSLRDAAGYADDLEAEPALSLRAWSDLDGSDLDGSDLDGSARQPLSAWATVRRMAERRSP